MIVDGAGPLARIGRAQMLTADACQWTLPSTSMEATALRKLMVFAMDCAHASGAGPMVRIGLAQMPIVVVRNDQITNSTLVY